MARGRARRRDAGACDLSAGGRATGRLLAAWLREILRDELGFAGAIFSDDLTMEGASAQRVASPSAQRAALEAGCDFALVCNDTAAMDQVLDAVQWTAHCRVRRAARCGCSREAQSINNGGAALRSQICIAMRCATSRRSSEGRAPSYIGPRQPGLSALDIASVVSVDADLFAVIDERRHLHRDSGLDLGGLEAWSPSRS